MDMFHHLVFTISSRDIAGLFIVSGACHPICLDLKDNQSFQSSAKVLDPQANPSLFQSTLAIIIKVCPSLDPYNKC